MVLYNINIKIIGDTWDYQDFHDDRISNFKFNVERIISHSNVGVWAGTDLNFTYNVETRRFTVVSLPKRHEGQLKRAFELSSDFRRQYFEK